MFDRCLYFNVNALSRSVSSIWKDAYAEIGLSPSHAYLLRLVLEQPGLAQREIAEILQLEKSTVTRAIDKMVEASYLARKLSPSGNQKEQNIFPTTKTKKIESRLNAIGDSLYKKMREEVGKDDFSLLVALMKSTNQKM